MNTRIGKSARILVCVVFVLLAASVHSQLLDMVHVSLDGQDGNSGASWTQAKATIQAGLEAAAPNGVVLVSNGEFTVAAEIALTDGRTVRALYGTNNPALETVVSGGNTTRVFNVNSGMLDGIVIANGLAEYAAGILMNNGTARYCRVEGNVAVKSAHTLGGGAMRLDGASLVTNCAIIRNRIQLDPETSDQYGGSAMTVIHEDVEVVDCLIAENSSDLTHYTAGTIYCHAGSGKFKSCVIMHNTNHIAGRIVSGISGLRMYDTIVASNCCVTAGFAPAVYLGAGSLASNLTIEANTGMRGVEMGNSLLIHSRVRLHEEVLHGGAGILCQLGGVIDGCLIESNSIAATANANGHGAGVWFGSTTATPMGGTIVNSTIRGNVHKQNRPGGGIAVLGHSTLISNCWIVGNAIQGSNGDGGGIGIYQNASSSNLLITHSVIAWNEADDAGGGISSPGDSQNVTIRNCLIYSNRAVRGGGVYLEGDVVGSTLVESCTIAGNTGLGTGAVAGLFASWSTNMNVINSIIYGNLTNGENSNWGRISSTGSQIVFMNCCTIPTNGMPGSANIEADPLFRAPEEGRYQLQSGSPCINTGMVRGWMQEGGAADLDGRARIDRFTRQADMGAYEYVPIGMMFSIR